MKYRTWFYTNSLAVMLMTASLIGNAAPIGMAAAAYLLSKENRANRGRVICAALLIIIAAITAWGALVAACFLIAALLTELWLTDNIAARLCRLTLALLTTKLTLFIIIPGISAHLQLLQSQTSLVGLAILLAIGAETFAHYRGQLTVKTDPLFVTLLTILFFAYAVTMALLAMSVGYPKAVLLATAGFCTLLAVAILLAAPFSERTAPRMVQHIFSLQVPIEDWVSRVSAIAAGQPNAADFTKTAMQEFMTLPDIDGVSWQLDDSAHHIGNQSHHTIELHCSPLQIRLHTQKRVSTWEWFNYYLLARITSEYCLAKCREERNRADNLIRAVHETGARLTHDIKNILHTLVTLTRSKDDALLRRQLPHLREKLENTLGKLQNSSDYTMDDKTTADHWWLEAQQRYAHHRVRFVGAASGSLPAALFDLALDNFINNALTKRQTTPDLDITVTLSDADNRATLEVTDSGAAVLPTVAKLLFVSPIDSQTGFGVALYQVGVEAAKYNHTAALSDNTDGHVVFRLVANDENRVMIKK